MNTKAPFLLSLMGFLFLAAESAAEPIALQEDAWRFVNAGAASFEAHKGRRALYLKNGSAILKEGEWENATVSFDLMFPESRGFVGLTFRRADMDNYENFYFRSHQSGNPDANQYTPVFNNSSAWQIYYGPQYASPIRYKYDEWMHVEITFSNDEMEVTLDGEPILHAPDLKRDAQSGGIGFWANETGAWFANLTVSDPKPFQSKPAASDYPPLGAIEQWEVSPSFPMGRLKEKGLSGVLKDVEKWQPLEVETNGVANLARVAKQSAGNMVLARKTINAENAGVERFQFGFSDVAHVYLNGKLLYEGDNSYGSRDYRYLGTVGLFDALALPLKKGKNELVVAVRESFGGWAVAGAFPDRAPVQKVINEKTGEAANAIDAFLTDMVQDGFGGAVVAAKDGEVILDAGYGYAVRQDKTPFTTDTIAQIGSLTKQFTAMAVIDLAVKGIIDFDEPVGSYLPEAAQPAASATVSQFLTHSSGMAEYCGDDFEKVSLEDLLKNCMARELRFQPGEETAYSNPGYSVLAAVVEAVSEETLDEYLRNNVLRPNGLNRTGYFLSEELDAAHGYLNGNDQGHISQRVKEMEDDYWALKGNGGMQASARDMYRWYQALSGEGALSAEHIEQALKPRTYSGQARNWDAYGWIIGLDENDNVMRISHSGSDGVFFSYFWWRPQEKAFYYMVGNSGEAQVLQAVRGVRSRLRDFYVAEDE